MKQIIILIVNFILVSSTLFANNNEWVSLVTPNKIYNVADYNGKYYFSSNAGLIVYDTTTGEQQQLLTKDGLPENGINKVVVDNAGSIWIGTYDNGIAVKTLNSNTWETIPLPGASLSSGNAVLNLLLDSEQNIWLTTFNTGILKYNTTTNEWTDFDLFAWDFFIDEADIVWTIGDEINTIENGQVTLTDIPAPPSSYGASRFYKSNFGHLFVINTMGIHHYVNDAWVNYPFPADATFWFKNVYANENHIWCSLEKGIYQLINQEWVRVIDAADYNFGYLLTNSNNELLVTLNTGFAPVNADNTLGEMVNFQHRGMSANWANLLPLNDDKMALRTFEYNSDDPNTFDVTVLDVNTLAHTPLNIPNFSGNNPQQHHEFYNPFRQEAGYLDSSTGTVHYAQESMQIYNANEITLNSYQANPFVDSRGHYWLRTTSGLFYSDGENSQIFSIDNTPFESNYFRSIAEDKEGQVWVTNGVNSTTTLWGIWDGTTWSNYLSGDDYPEIDNNPTIFTFDDNNVLWFGRILNDLKYYDGNNFGTYTNDELIAQLAYITDVAFYNNEIIIASRYGLAIVSGNETNVYNTDNSEITDDVCLQVKVDSNGNIWTTHEYNGVSIFNRADLALGENPAPILQAQVFLEGAYGIPSGAMHTQYADQNALPTTPPYTQAPWNYTPTNNDEITNPSTTTYITDWVLVEALDASFNSIQVQAALLDRLGNLRSTDGSLGVKMNLLDENQQYYFIIRHRNHLDVISDAPLTLNNTTPYDFTNPANVMNGFSQLKDLGNGVYAMHSGDTDGNGVISVIDFNAYAAQSGNINQYLNADHNIDNSVTIADFNLYLPNASVIGVTYVRY